MLTYNALPVTRNCHERQNEKMRKLLEQITGSDADHIKISMSLVEAISGGTAEYNGSVTRQQKLLNDLTEKRSVKVSKEVKATSSVLNLLNLWGEEEGREEAEENEGGNYSAASAIASIRIFGSSDAMTEQYFSTDKLTAF